MDEMMVANRLASLDKMLRTQAGYTSMAFWGEGKKGAGKPGGKNKRGA